jgi:MOSC domain-containing protein YiiM
VIGDKFHSKDPNRSVLLASTKSYDMAKERGIEAPLGSLGENILMNYNPYDFPIGTNIYIGDAIFEIVQYCTICKSLAKVDKTLPKLLKNDRGVFAKVVKEGKIELLDEIKI